jgi:hypothetical protein
MAPLPFPCLANKPSAHWIECNVTPKLKQVTILVDKDAFVPPLKDMTNPLVPAIEVLRVKAVQLPHSMAEVTFNRFDHDMVMVPHLAVGMHVEIKAAADQAHNAEPFLSISIVNENKPMVIAAGGHVI